MLVKDIMTAHAEWIGAGATLREVARKMREQDIGCLPVGDNDRLIGMITDRDICCRAVAEGLDPTTTKAKDVMSKGIVWCYDDQTDAEAITLMEDKKIHHLPVLNRRKRIVGVLSLGDLALRSPQAMAKDLMHLASRDASRHADRASSTH
jgi:CBS domain-containing protein